MPSWNPPKVHINDYVVMFKQSNPEYRYANGYEIVDIIADPFKAYKLADKIAKELYTGKYPGHPKYIGHGTKVYARTIKDAITEFGINPSEISPYIDKEELKTIKSFSVINNRIAHLQSRIRNFAKTDEDYEKEFIDLINTSDYSEFVEDLKVSAKDPKVRNLIDHMMTVGDRMYSRRNVIAVNKLIPTQNEIDVTKSLSYPLTHLDSCQKCFETKPIVIKLPLVTYDTKYIVDGHHRWSQVYCMNPQAKMDCFDLLTKHLKPIDVLRVIQLKIAADTGDVKVAKVEGQNLLTIDAKKLVKYIDETMIPEVDEYLKGQYKVSSREDVINKIIDNVKEMRKTSQPIKDAPERGVMPQTDAIPDLESDVKKGKVTGEYKEP